MIDQTKKRYRFRLVVPAFPAINIYSIAARRTTALGPVCVASSVARMAKWDAEVIDENNLRIFGPKNNSGKADHEFLQKTRPADVVGLYGGLTSTIPRLYEIARFYKNKGAVIVAGGHHFCEETIPEALYSGIDYVVIDEGEETITELLAALEENRDVSGIKGIAYIDNGRITFTQKREPITDFDKLPIPNFSLVRYAKMKIYPVERIRGCGMNCEFCAVKGKPRRSSVERLFERISHLAETRNARNFFIVDDLFGQDREETIRFCNMMYDYQRRIGKRIGLGVQIRLDKANDHELLSAMRRAGVNGVAIGFESPIEEELKAMQKHLKPANMIQMARTFRKFGFIVHGMFIFGYPSAEGVKFSMTARERMRHFKNFIRKAGIDTVQILLPVPLPGTEFRRRLEAANRLYPLQNIGWEYYDGNFPLFEPDEPLTAEEIQDSAWGIMNKFYQFKYMLFVVLNLFSFPGIIFFLHNIKAGWRRWYREMRGSIIRVTGWIFLKQWTAAFQKGVFLQKLSKAKDYLKTVRT
ncbi:MAG: B12-binding domain-containing radical SAM protein [Candidatus Omnitrophica bacterium]|nr:B12-binding domain-containing radical SAM protein [Candidatus Omnitrophota bacterium]MBU4488520.1 B12-binding domain-containing radical SAM protein [Candidatus Omnitrophota bacterium]MCG2704568.1 B12-binding domain-containing radical SAM protein [Candidatus Omnitrophota bacterium]